jgi:hypothetical protein
MVQARSKRFDAARSTTRDPVAGPGALPVLVTWESELRAIAEEAARWTVETGGDLFGQWASVPTIYLATRTGPYAVRDQAHFRLDVNYLRTLSAALAADWDLRYLGDWHSHHRLGLTQPSPGDRRRILRLAARNVFPAMAEIIVTFDEKVQEAPLVRAHPWVYGSVRTAQAPVKTGITVLPGTSPIREALVARGALPEQELERWVELPPARVRIGSDSESPAFSSTAPPLAAISDRVLDHAKLALEGASSGSVERHAAGFGTILAAPVDGKRLVGIAVSATWPHAILEVDWIDRERQTTEPLNLEAPPTLLVPSVAAALYRAALDLRSGAADVDHGAA